MNCFKKINVKLFTQHVSITNLQKVWSRNYVARRALMYVPGNDTKKISKAFSLDVDCLALDCEDGVAINQKEQARFTIKDILDKLEKNKKRRYDLGVRINSIYTDWWKDDLKTILSAQNLPDTILLPKVHKAEDLVLFADELRKLNIRNDSQINLIIYIESAKAFINLKQICDKAMELSNNSKFILTSLVFGSDDFCANIGVTRTEESMEILYARQKLVLYAKAYNLQAIDMVYIKFKDLNGLKHQSVEGARMGYTGKQVIHPDQVPIVQEAFLPNKQQINWALDLLKAFDEHQKSGTGAFTFKGSMIDMPTMKQAQNIIDLISSINKGL